jgi:hypothetical protein
MAIRPFSLDEVEAPIKEMKTNNARGPGGFPVIFNRKLWGRGGVLEMVDYANDGGFLQGGLELEQTELWADCVDTKGK